MIIFLLDHKTPSHPRARTRCSALPPRTEALRTPGGRTPVRERLKPVGVVRSWPREICFRGPEPEHVPSLGRPRCLHRLIRGGLRCSGRRRVLGWCGRMRHPGLRFATSIWHSLRAWQRGWVRSVTTQAGELKARWAVTCPTLQQICAEASVVRSAAWTSNARLAPVSRLTQGAELDSA
jgi:hypothetical protein